MLRLTGIRSVYVSTMARLDPDTPRSLKKWVLDRLKRVAYSAFHALVCSTSTLSGDLTGLGVNPDKVRTIPNGVALNRFRPAKSIDEVRALRQALHLPIDGPIVLYVGLRVDRKGVIELVDAWKRYRVAGGAGWLVIVGQERRDDEEYASFYARWDRCVAAIRPEDQIELRGPYAQIEEYFRCADLFVLLSELEGMPNVIPEAMASGVPVLTTQFRGFSTDLGRDGRELVITQRNPEEVSEALSRLLGDPQRLGTLAAAGRTWVQEHQDVERTLDRYRLLLEHLVAPTQLSGKRAPCKISR
jgi:glycosyltransferase involved in cell wall biosynthesis